MSGSPVRARCRSHSPTGRSHALAQHSFAGAVEVGGVRMLGGGQAPSFAGKQLSAIYVKESGDEDLDDDDFLSRTQRNIQLQMRELKNQSFLGATLRGKQAEPQLFINPDWFKPADMTALDVWPTMATKKKELCDGKVAESHEGYLKSPENVALLQKGGHLFSFTCHTADQLTPYELKMLDTGINISSFPDETEYGVPSLDTTKKDQLNQYTYIFAKSCYVLPGVTVSDLTPKFVSSYAYQKASQPSTSHIFDDVTDENTFRMSKTVIRFIFSLTLQFKVSRIQDDLLPGFSDLLGVPVDGGLLLERTRRSKTSKPDTTAKAKSYLLYTSIKGGVLCTNYTNALQSSLPGVVSKLMNSFGSMGEAEVGETARNTRKFLKEKFPTSA